ncbi:hypothetical protein EVAR_100105_1 [Eumeta japonica]|uniref:Uncharacterized protein n=1 Tax=Eumeta variegata TaxID=151549 RepID=A0A4C1YVZ0_EUMVA|nr:hypothetical protein EVAR_100105_1 [Eumeta japonica]
MRSRQVEGGIRLDSWCSTRVGGRRSSSCTRSRPPVVGRWWTPTGSRRHASVTRVGVDLTERACRPLIRLSKHRTTAARAVRVSELRPLSSSFFNLRSSSFNLQSGAYAGPPVGARVIAHALAAGWGGTGLRSGGCRGRGGGHGSAMHASASRCPLLLAPALVWVVFPIGEEPPKHRFTIRIIVPTMSGQAPRRLQRGRRAASDTSASGKRRGRPYQCTLHVRGGRGAEPPSF